jgi:hypothetical protein
MATSSRQSSLFGINDWKAIYQTFREADFRSYDYETLRKSFIDYLRLYYPETYNDYIESSEFIALLDVIAFMGQGLAFRSDLNARENFMDTAERRDSVVKLANLVSYTPKRNLAAQGYIKIVGITTTQNITDINGINLSNIPILYNDPANPNWLEQFNTVINAALVNSQKIGRPGNTSTLLGIKTDEYSINIPENSNPVIPFSTVVDGIDMNFELVSVTSVDEDYIYELPPAPTNKFNMVFRNDQLGFGSPNTGYFFYFKQGVLQTSSFNLQQQISNQVVDIDIQGVNNTDTWLYQFSADNASLGLWRLVENVYANAYLQTEKSNRKTFSVSSRFNDQVSYVFGDGVFSEIPVGSFVAYVRSSNGLTYTIDPIEMQGIAVSISYVSRVGKIETLTLNLELQLPVSNAQARETLANIKQRAPTRYYTQNRMVNGEDYNNFPYTLYSSIIKSKAINRSSVGVSKNLDLLDPTGKYSSTNSFADDGAIYQNYNDGVLTLNVTSTSAVISFLNTTLADVLAGNKAKQYYIQNYPRYNITFENSDDGKVYWNNSTTDNNSVTGYFYYLSNGNKIPLSTGIYSTNSLQYVAKGSLVLFQAPAGYYFDNNNRLVTGSQYSSYPTTLWTTVLNVVGDGYNNGEGNFPNGSGPVTLNNFMPNNCVSVEVIPTFDNSLSAEIIQQCLDRIELQQSFSLVFNNSLPLNQDRWSISFYDDSNYFINFLSITGDTPRYTISYRALTYYFGSVSDIRFVFDGDKIVYDPFTGKILQDFVNVLAVNSRPNSNQPMARNVQASIVGQPVQPDGYENDFEVEIASIDINNREIVNDPDFFTTVTGYDYENVNNNFGKYVFFRLIQDAINLERYQIIPTTDVVYQYPTQTQIEVVKYDYPVGQLYYAYGSDEFYITVQDPTVSTVQYTLVKQQVGKYIMLYGRQGLKFQYRHNSNNTTRIDPVTTNIIDLYVVTQSYYTQYQNWIQDSTNTIVEPDKPTINQLNSEYGKIQDYKMLTDSVILNGVVFKPLFGSKAAPALRATVKVIRASKTNASDSEIRTMVLNAMNSYFDINNWNFGDTFYFSELSAYLHAEVGELISSVVLVPNDPTMSFGDLYEIKCSPYEIFVNGATANDIQVIPALTPSELQVR